MEEGDDGPSYPFSLPEYKRYGRQMILPGFGLQGQIKLSQSRVLVVGAGGLGCPAVQYLAAAGVGHISIVDHDHVETSNLARQILHTDGRLGMNKALSAATAARIINPHIHLEAVQEAISAANAVSLISQHDIVLDCTDNVLTRYLISDAAVMSGVQVVSGAGQGLEGQVVVLHKDLDPGASASGWHSSSGKIPAGKRGPCYRCLFPKAPRPEDVTDCEDGGVLGTVTGLVGTMQALQAIKLLTGLPDEDEPLHMTLVSPFSYPPFRSVRLRERRSETCRACGDEEVMAEDVRKTKIAPDLSQEDYVAFCGLIRTLNGDRADGMPEIEAKQLKQKLGPSEGLLIDVRPEVEYEIVRLPYSSSLPLRTIQTDPIAAHAYISDLIQRQQSPSKEGKSHAVYLICRKGNDSRIAQRSLSDLHTKTASSQETPHPPLTFINVTGGLQAWSSQVDSTFPLY